MQRWISARANSSQSRNTGGILPAVSGVLAGSALAGLTVAVLGRCVELLWSLEGRHHPLRWCADRRRRRWLAASAEVGAAITATVNTAPGRTADVRAALRARDRWW